MGQTFQYPNLLSGTRDGTGWTHGGHTPSSIGYSKSIGALYVQGTATKEFFLYSPPVVLHKNTDYTLHCLTANTENMYSMDIWVLDIDGSSDSYQWVGAALGDKNPGPWGTWLDWTFRLDDNARDGATFIIRFDNNGSKDGKNCLIWFRDIMLTEGTTPRAWAPAKGETLAGEVLS